MKKLLIRLAIGFGAFICLFAFSVVIAKVLFDGESSFTGPGVGVVEVKGVIVDSKETIRQLAEMKKNDMVKAVVLRVDSPGGVVGPAQEIYEEVRKLKLKKKVVVSMGSLAASGGYYIAAPADVIYANPGTITGSIGVLIKFTEFKELMDKIGMSMTTVKAGTFKDVGSPARTMTPAEKAMIQSVIDSSYEQFVGAVAEGRKLPVAEVKGLAEGKIYTGAQAQKLKLVDKLGNLQDAIAEAARLAGLKGEPEVIMPTKKKKGLVDLLVDETTSQLRESLSYERAPFSLNYELNH